MEVFNFITNKLNDVFSGLYKWINRKYFNWKSETCYKIAEEILILSIAVEETAPDAELHLRAARDNLYKAAQTFTKAAEKWKAS